MEAHQLDKAFGVVG